MWWFLYECVLFVLREVFEEGGLFFIFNGKVGIVVYGFDKFL